jgi:hypothetical protein
MVLPGVAGLRLLIPTCILSSDREITCVRACMCARARVVGAETQLVSECPLESPPPHHYRRSCQQQSHTPPPQLSSKRRPHFETRTSLGKSNNMAIGPDGTRNQDVYSDEDSSNPIYRSRSMVNGVKQDYSFNGTCRGFLHTFHENGVKALCYKPEGRGFDTRWGEFLNLPNPSGRTRPWGLLSPQQKLVPETGK